MVRPGGDVRRGAVLNAGGEAGGLAEGRRLALERGRARFAALRRLWAGPGPAERPAGHEAAAEQAAPAEGRPKGDVR